MSESTEEGTAEVYHAISDFMTTEEGKVKTDHDQHECVGKISPQLQLLLSHGDEVIVQEKVNDSWWWVELNGELGYVPANHLSPGNLAEWQNDEYFSSYDALVSQSNLMHVPLLKI